MVITWKTGIPGSALRTTVRTAGARAGALPPSAALSTIVRFCAQDAQTEGRAHVSQGPAEIEAMRQELFHVYFPVGKSDPQISVITSRPERVEDWNSAGLGKLSFLLEAAKAYATRMTVETRDAELLVVPHI